MATKRQQRRREEGRQEGRAEEGREEGRTEEAAARRPLRGAKAKVKRKPNAAFMKPLTPTGPLAAIVARCRCAHGSHQQDLGVHQEEQAAGRREPPHDQRRRQAEGLFARRRRRCSN